MSLRLLFVHNYPAKFVQIDRALLSEQYAVQEWHQRGRLVNVPALARAVAQSDLVFGWFASWHTFLPITLSRALARPAVLVVGGYDTANMPEIGYGHQRGGFKRWLARTTMQQASALVTNSCYARDEAIRNAHVERNRVTVIYHGLADGGAVNGNHKDNLVVTAAMVDRGNLSRKGLEAFTRAAAFLPAFPFALIGAWRADAISYLRKIAPANVQFTGWLSDAELSDYFSRARVYVQASCHEAFGLAVAEAMLHGCVPVVTRAGALPEVIGDAGIYVQAATPAAVADGVRQALNESERLGQRARDRVRREFPLEERRKRLYDLVEGTVKIA